MSGGNLLAVLFRPYRIWAVASVHAQAQRLAKLHRTIAKRFQIGDRVVYLGNVIGRGTALRETLAELLAFRRRAPLRPMGERRMRRCGRCARARWR